jgi:DHA1 family bicyclomycin/chloramphenicol resistance-like MFS transporter
MIVGHGVQASATPLALTVAGGMLFSLATWALLLRR